MINNIFKIYYNKVIKFKSKCNNHKRKKPKEKFLNKSYQKNKKKTLKRLLIYLMWMDQV